MTYGQIKRSVLEHLNRATINGESVPPSYNGQSDDLRRIWGLVNEAVVTIRTRYKRETAVYYPKDGYRAGSLYRYELPADFYALRSGGIYRLEGGEMIPCGGARFFGRELLLGEGEYAVEYYRYPDLLPEDPEDSYEFSQDPEVLGAAMYYAAANLALAEDEFLYTALLREYEARLGRMLMPVQMVCGKVKDVYSGGEGA